MIFKENIESPNSSYLIKEANTNLKYLGKKLSKPNENSQEKDNNPSKTKIHGIVFKKNDVERKVKKITCNCKNSQCLKLYCECFSKLAFCDPEICSCKGCANTEENEVIFTNLEINIF